MKDNNYEYIPAIEYWQCPVCNAYHHGPPIIGRRVCQNCFYEQIRYY